MTPDQEDIVKQYGKEAVEVFNIAHHHSKSDSPCTCSICRNTYDKISQWIKATFGNQLGGGKR